MAAPLIDTRAAEIAALELERRAARAGGDYATSDEIQGRLRQMRRTLTREKDPTITTGRQKTRRAANKRHHEARGRFKTFAGFLLETYSLDSGCLVLDVAGGGGELSWRLALLGVPSCVVDPRFVAFSSKTTQKILSGRSAPHICKCALGRSSAQHHPTCAADPASVASSTSTPSSSEGIGPQDDQSNSSAADDCATRSAPPSTSSAITSPIAGQMDRRDWLHPKALERALRSNGARTERELAAFCGLPLSSVTAPFAADFPERHSTLFAAGSRQVLVGLHADQATEALVDVALRLELPFAVVPCCVFASASPGRVLPSGEAVESHEQFVEYLQLKHPSIRRLSLDGLGRRNVILYRQ